MFVTETPSVPPTTLLACAEAICSGQIAQNKAPSPETGSTDAAVAHGGRTVRRTVLRAVILGVLVILTVLWTAATPLEAWWIERRTATSWPLWWSPLATPPEVSPLRISLTLPDDRRPEVGESFPLTLGLGTRLSAEQTVTLTVHAPGFDITDKSGTVHPDTYTHTLTDFSHKRYGMVSTQNRIERVWEMERLYLCGHTEDITLRWRGEAPATDVPCITASLQTVGTDDHTAHEYAATAVYYTVKNDRIRLMTEPPSRGCASFPGDALGAVTESAASFPRATR